MANGAPADTALECERQYRRARWPTGAPDGFERKLAAGAIASDDTRLRYRRLLHWAMSSEGFENDPFTFWHYDWGSQLYVKMTRALRANPAKAAWYGYIAPPMSSMLRV